jgi:hypothetical protein
MQARRAGPLTFAETVEICRTRPTGMAGTEVVEDLLDEIASASRDRWPRAPEAVHWAYTAAASQKALELAGPSARRANQLVSSLRGTGYRMAASAASNVAGNGEPSSIHSCTNDHAPSGSQAAAKPASRAAGSGCPTSASG